MSKDTVRLDWLLVDRGYFDTRAQAKAAIMSGMVYVDGKRCDKAGSSVTTNAVITLEASNPYVSRGGLKLERALDLFGISPQGKSCLDIGASTGGFTDCLLQRGATRVIAVDVGYGQLAWKLRQDPRVEVLERTNFRHVAPGTFSGVQLATIDVSFISLLKILPALAGNVEADVDVIGLVKPQFEAGRDAVSKGSGVVREPDAHVRVLQETLKGAGDLGWVAQGIAYSPITGPKGNIEFLAWWRLGSPEDQTSKVTETTIRTVVDEAHQVLT